MKRKFRFYFFVLINLTSIQLGFGQTYPSTEEGYNYPTKTNSSLPPIKVLVVPVELVGGNCNTVGDQCFPANGIPSDIDKYFDYLPSTNPTGYITKYYYDASLGNFTVLGDYLTQPVKIPCGTAPSNFQKVANEAMYSQFGLSLPLAHGSNLSEFDKYSLDENQVQGYPKDPTPNYRFDHVIYLCRDVPGWGNANGYGCAVNTFLGGEFHERFENFPRPTFVTGGNGISWSGSNVYFSEGAGSVSSTYSSNADGYLAMGLLAGANLNQMTSPKLEFDHICASENNLDFGRIEYLENPRKQGHSFRAMQGR